MSIEPVAWMHIQGYYFEPSYRQLADDEVERGWEQSPLYSQSAIDELQRQLDEANKEHAETKKQHYLVTDEMNDRFDFERKKLKLQLAEAQEVGRNLSSTWKSTEDELQRQIAVKNEDITSWVEKYATKCRQLAEAQDLASQINTDWIPANKRLAEKLAEREAVIERLREALREAHEQIGDDIEGYEQAKRRIEALAIPTDHTALDEAIKKAKVVTGDTSDGYHTFDELYQHRHALFIKLMRAYPHISWRANNHEDGTMFEGGWFIAGMHLPTGDISYHIPIDYWEILDGVGIATSLRGKRWDGHTSADVINRLNLWANCRMSDEIRRG